VSSCLEKDPEERFQTIHDVKLRLLEIKEAPALAVSAPAGEAQRSLPARMCGSTTRSETP